MRKIKLTEEQILMLKKIQETKTKSKVLRVSESQYNRIFKGNSSPSKSLTKSFNKIGIKEDSTNDIDMIEFAQELIVFIKDVLSRPKTMPFSTYWEGLGISKNKLFKMVKSEGLLKFGDETGEIKEYVTPKVGFRKGIKGIYKKVSEGNSNLNEMGDAGYAAGADMDSNATFNNVDAENQDEVESIKSEKEIMGLVYFNSDLDGLSIFNYGGDLFYISLSDLTDEDTQPYEDIEGHPNKDTMYHYVNDKLLRKEIKVFKKNAPHGQISLITPTLRETLLSYYGEDEKLVSILSQLPESTTASSSGSFTPGGISNELPKRNNGMSPKEALQDISEVVPDIDETTTTGSVGGDSGTFAYDAPTGDGSKFWNAGNKLNKTQGSSIVRGGEISEDEENPRHKYFRFLTQWKKRGHDREANLKLLKNLKLAASEIGIDFLGENRVIKVTSEQLQKIVESENKTMYKDGEMIGFDDCTKLDNNKKAQNGECSQGAKDSVVKLNKTKDSVMGEANSGIDANGSQRLIPLFVDAINKVDENLGYEELAKAIGYIINEHYGTHLGDRFIGALNKIIGGGNKSQE